jgi:Holliday junction resolvase
MRKYARTDRNHKEIVNALRSIGCSVLSLAALGKGVPDLLVARKYKTILIEVKDGTKPPSGQKLTSDQRDWIPKWGGLAVTVTSSEDALRVAAKWL